MVKQSKIVVGALSGNTLVIVCGNRNTEKLQKWESMPPVKICIVTLFTPNLMAYGWNTSRQKKEYAAGRGYGFVCHYRVLDDQRHPAWSKIPALIEILESGDFDWVFWTDADSMIVKDVPLEDFIDETSDIVICKDPQGPMNAGNFLIRSSPQSIAFLREAYRQVQFINHCWWEQAAFNFLYSSGYPIKFRIGDFDFNALGHLRRNSTFVWHLAGCGDGHRIGAFNREFLGHSFHNRQDLCKVINRFGSELRGVEIGVGSGEFSEYLLRESRFQTFYCIDPWRRVDDYRDIANCSDEQHERKFQKCQDRLKGFDCVKYLRYTSGEAANEIPDASLDFVHIDANHAYEFAKRDIEIYYQKLKPGGILSGHDYLDGERYEGSFGVKMAVDEFVIAHHLPRLFVTPESWPTWFIYRK
jgi:hypothetical protein